MNDQRYHELLGHLLDDNLTAKEADELAECVHQNPTAQADVKRHLYLWELYSQQCQRERTAEAFTEACKTRIAAEIDENSFVGETKEKLRDAVEKTGRAERRPAISLNDWLRRFLPSPRWALAGGIALLVALGVWLFPPTNNTPTLAVAAGTRVTLERDGQSSLAQSGVKLSPGDLLRISGTNGATLAYGAEKTHLTLTNSAELRILSWAKGKHFELRQGQLEAAAARQRPFKPLLVRTPQAEARVLGTKFTLTVTNNATRLDVAEGEVRLTRVSDGAHADVPAEYYTIAATNVELAALPMTGRILREYWTNLTSHSLAPAGSTLRSKRTSADIPDGWDYLERFQSKPVPRAPRFVERIRGYVHPPTNGLYHFAITTLHVETALHLSRSDKPEDLWQIAWKRPNGRGPTLDEVIPVPLQAGRKYYIEIVHESDGDREQLAVSWQAPGGEPEIIPGKFLSPFPVQERKGQR